MLLKAVMFLFGLHIVLCSVAMDTAHQSNMLGHFGPQGHFDPEGHFDPQGHLSRHHRSASTPHCASGNGSCDASLSRLVSFSPDYNLLEHPPTQDDDTPLEVGFQINLRNLLEVNEVSQICSLETTIRIYWEDK